MTATNPQIDIEDMDRIQLINGLIAQKGYKRYLEIGVKKGSCFESIKVAHKTGVDPDMRALKPKYEKNWLKRLVTKPKQGFWHHTSDNERLYELTSDDYFSRFDDQYDIIFIDGLHQFDQVLKDYVNAQNHLAPGGCVVLHDCNPLTEQAAERERSAETKVWNGDTWKAVYHLRRRGQQINVFEFDHGCGVAPKQPLPAAPWTEQDIRELKAVPFQNLANDRANAVGLIGWQGFEKVPTA